ncbi:MAG: cell division protein ZapA [Nitrospinota bacterium]|nr:cell division protein ZapA [Nitrospinota bacterium]MDH5677448.1 cell division protein ZapA [Nitrospinota bacterium]MDH5756833.1 cell division protein ZapA [Nitrospinota bacterium]
MNKEGKRVNITVYGMDLSIISSEDPAKTRQYADYVDTLMRQIATRIGGHTELSRVAMLALLQIAHELFALKEKTQSEGKVYQAKLDKLIAEIDAAVSLSGVQTEIGQPEED